MPAENTTPPAAAATERQSNLTSKVWASARFLFALFLFIGALQVIKTGASALDFISDGGFLTRNAGSTFGLGWLGAMLVLSGSPVVATGLAFVSTGAIDAVQGFTMVTGGRIGAAFVVLLVAVLYALRGQEGKKKNALSTAVMALVITFIMYMPGMVVGLWLLNGPLQGLRLGSPAGFTDLIEIVYGPLLRVMEDAPPLLLFVGGIAGLVISFKMIDALVPEFDESRFQGARTSWLRRKWPMFFLGVFVTILTMSVSVALTVLVPLQVKGYVKREDLIPYIVGADIGTLVDKLLIAFLVGVGSQHPFIPVQIILAEIAGAALVGLILMVALYPQFKRGVWRFQRQIVKSKPRLAAFTVGLLLVPIAVMAVSGAS